MNSTNIYHMCLSFGICFILFFRTQADPTFSYAFIGIVEGQNQSTLDQLDHDENTYIVRVQEIHLQDGVYEDQTGELITVWSPNQTLLQDQEYLILAQPFMFGESIAVELIIATDPDIFGGGGDDGKSKSKLTTEIADYQSRVIVSKRQQAADLIINGSIVSATPLEIATDPGERKKKYVQVKLKVREVLKGKLGEKETTFLYASDKHDFKNDLVFTKGEKAIFMLRTGEQANALTKVNPSRLMLLHRHDKQSVGKLQLIKTTLLQEGKNRKSEK